MSRLHETLRVIPPATKGVIGLCACLFLVKIFTDQPPLRSVTLCPRLVVYDGEIYRILTSTVYHASLMHIGMNMMSTAAVGTILEKRLGTLRLCATMLMSTVVISLLYISAAVVLDVVFGRKGLMNQHAVGFSGVIFHLSVLECNLGSFESTRSVAGMFNVPSYLYPWVLLVVLQMFMPNLSFEGHLSGIIAGTLQLYGMLDALMPSEAFLSEMDRSSRLQWLSSAPNFVGTTNWQTLSAGHVSSWIRSTANSVGLGSLFAFLGKALVDCRDALLRRGRATPRIVGLEASVASCPNGDEEADQRSSETERLTTSHIV